MKLEPEPASKIASRSAVFSTVTLQSGVSGPKATPFDSRNALASASDSSGNMKETGWLSWPSLTTVISAPPRSMAARARGESIVVAATAPSPANTERREGEGFPTSRAAPRLPDIAAMYPLRLPRRPGRQRDNGARKRGAQAGTAGDQSPQHTRCDPRNTIATTTPFMLPHAPAERWSMPVEFGRRPGLGCATAWDDRRGRQVACAQGRNRQGPDR
jgi:hypothetical protein